MADKYYVVGQGSVYMAPRDSTGQIGGYEWIGDVQGFTISTSQDTLEGQEDYSGKRVTVYSIVTSTDVSFSMDVKNINGKNLARAYYGTTASGSGATVTAEAVTAYNDSVFPLAYPNVSSVVVKKGVTTLVLNTDYTVDAVNGLITILPGSTQVPAGPGIALTVDYTYAAYSAKVETLVSDAKEYAIMFSGKSQTDNLPVRYVLHRAKPGLAASLDLIGTDISLLTIEGQCLPAQEITSGGLSKYMSILQA